MERYIGIWHKEGTRGEEDVGELVVDGNNIEFYSRHGSEPFPCAYIGHVESMQYKIIINGPSTVLTHRTLEPSTCHHVICVLRQSEPISEGMNISGIEEVVFEIPEIVDWLGIKTVYYSVDDNGIFVSEINSDSIVLSQDAPHVELFFRSKTLTNSIEEWDTCAIKVESRPMIRVQYEEPVDYNTVVHDIRCICQFFSLLIGYVSGISSIIVRFEGHEGATELFLNADYSYNYGRYKPTDRPRTYYYLFETTITQHFCAWREFYSSSEFSFIRRMYFSANGQKTLFAEDILIQYLRFLEGYHLRISQDEAASARIEQATKLSSKAIHDLIFSEDGKPLFEEALKEAIPDYKFNSKHVREISKWIASGFIGKTSLSERLHMLSVENFCIIENNAKAIERLAVKDLKLSKEKEEAAVQAFLKHLSDTRNYYSHFKSDKTGLLTYSQICDSINVLKAIILSVFYHRLGIEEDMIRKILLWDSELHFQTQYLRREGEQPFLPPPLYYRSLQAEGGSS